MEEQKKARRAEESGVTALVKQPEKQECGVRESERISKTSNIYTSVRER